MESELKPCPFCGSTPSTDYVRENDVGVGCEAARCGVEPAVYGRTIEEAVRYWNTRAPDARDAEIERLRSVQGACRERIYQILCDEDLTDDKLRTFSEGGLPEIHDALHQASGYSPSECFTDEPAEAFLRKRADAEIARLRAVLEWAGAKVLAMTPTPWARHNVESTMLAALARDWPAVRAAGVVLPGEE